MHFAPPNPARAKAARDQGIPRRLWLHAGLHKTGTTSLQSFLVENRAELAASGLLYARAGTNQYLSGNHNVAWELSHDHRFELDTGTLQEAAEEIADFEGDAILSSEDFESLLHRPRGFDRLFRHELLRWHQITVVVYIRNQAEYLASLLVENRKHGLQATTADYLRPILADGRLAVRDWVYQFDLGAMAKCWPYHNVKLLLRNYHALAGGSTVTDFLGVTGSKLQAGPGPRLNATPQMSRLADPAATQLMARFGPVNRRLCAQYAIPPDGLCDVPEWPEGAARLD